MWSVKGLFSALELDNHKRGTLAHKIKQNKVRICYSIKKINKQRKDKCKKKSQLIPCFANRFLDLNNLSLCCLIV